MKLSLSEIEQGIRAALAEFKLLHGDEFEISEDFYWTIQTAQRFSINEEPVPVLGSLADHVASIKRANAGDEQPPEVLLVDVAEVLKYLSNANFKSE